MSFCYASLTLVCGICKGALVAHRILDVQQDISKLAHLCARCHAADSRAAAIRGAPTCAADLLRCLARERDHCRFPGCIHSANEFEERLLDPRTSLLLICAYHRLQTTFTMNGCVHGVSCRLLCWAMLFYGTRLENADVVPENWRESRLLNSTSVPLVANCLAFVLCMHSDHWNCPLFRFFLRRLKLDLAILAGSGVICSIRKLQTATGEQQSRCRSNERRQWHVLGP